MSYNRPSALDQVSRDWNRWNQGSFLGRVNSTYEPATSLLGDPESEEVLVGKEWGDGKDSENSYSASNSASSYDTGIRIDLMTAYKRLEEKYNEREKSLRDL